MPTRPRSTPRRRPSRSPVARPSSGPASTGPATRPRAPAGGSPPPTPTSRGTARLKAPGAAPTRPHGRRPPTSSAPPSQANRYRAFSDVTAAVAARRQRHLHRGERPGRHGQRPLRRLGAVHRLPRQRTSGPWPARLRRPGHRRPTHTFQTTVAPFHTPVSRRAVTTKVGLLTFEGDAGLATETATFNGLALTDALNPVNNAMNSTIESGGTPSPRRARLRQPAGDGPRRLPNPAALTNDQTTASLKFSSTNEYFMPSAFFLVSDEGPATISVPPSVIPRGRRPGARRRDAERRPGHLERHGHADLHLSVAALRRRRQWLPGHPGRHQQHLHADRRRRRRHGPRRRHRHQRRRGDVQRLRADRGRRRAAGQHRAAHASRAGDGGPAAHRGCRQLDRHRSRHARLSVAALRRTGNNCQDIAGATGSTYTPSAGDVGGTVRVVVTSTNASARPSPLRRRSPSARAAPPLNQAARPSAAPASRARA